MTEQVLREDQACATALILACSGSVQDAQVADWATQALFLHGGDVKVTSTAFNAMTSPSSPYLPSGLATPTGYQQSHSTFTSPISAFNPNAISTPQMSQSVADVSMTTGQDYQFSGRHNGLYLFFGRILRPVWQLALAKEVGVGKAQLLDSVVTSEELIAVILQLNALKSFVHNNIHQTSINSNFTNATDGTSRKGPLQVRI